MADSLFFGHGSPRSDRSASCSSHCSLGTRWKEIRTGCPAFLSKFIVIGAIKLWQLVLIGLSFNLGANRNMFMRYSACYDTMGNLSLSMIPSGAVHGPH